MNKQRTKCTVVKVAFQNAVNKKSPTDDLSVGLKSKIKLILFNQHTASYMKAD
jgi:hypothetical protein